MPDTNNEMVTQRQICMSTTTMIKVILDSTVEIDQTNPVTSYILILGGEKGCDTAERHAYSAGTSRWVVTGVGCVYL